MKNYGLQMAESYFFDIDYAIRKNYGYIGSFPLVQVDENTKQCHIHGPGGIAIDQDIWVTVTTESNQFSTYRIEGTRWEEDGYKVVISTPGDISNYAGTLRMEIFRDDRPVGWCVARIRGTSNTLTDISYGAY